jgi:hypothetical protein
MVRSKRLRGLGVGKVNPPQHIKDAQRKARAAESYRMRRYSETREQAREFLMMRSEDSMQS